MGSGGVQGVKTRENLTGDKILTQIPLDFPTSAFTTKSLE